MKNFFTRKSFWIPVVTIVVLLVLVYFGGGYVVYTRAATVSSTPEGDLTNNPSSFDVNDKDYNSFNTAPYFISQYETVEFPSRQPNSNITLSGWYIETDPTAPVVIITHGVNSSRRDAKALVPAGMLAHNGFNVLLYDLRNHGESDKDNGRTSMGNKEYQDVLGAWDYLVKVKGYAPSRIGLFAISLGSGATLMAFGQEPRLAAAFIDSPFFNLTEQIKAELVKNKFPTILASSAVIMARVVGGDSLLAHSPADAINNDNGRPLYVVHGTADTRISINQTYELQELATTKGANVTVWITDSGHVYSMFTHTSEYEQRLVSFFKAALK